MKKIYLFLIFLATIGLSNEIKIEHIKNIKSSSIGDLSVKLMSLENGSEGVLSETFLLSKKMNSEFIIRLPEKEKGLTNISDFKLVSDTSLIIYESSFTKISSWIFNIKSFEKNYLGNGKVEVLDENRFIVRNSKKYLFINGISKGAYWVDKVVDAKGDLIKFLSKDDKSNLCYPLSIMLDEDKSYPKLTQSLNDCIYVQK